MDCGFLHYNFTLKSMPALWISTVSAETGADEVVLQIGFYTPPSAIVYNDLCHKSLLPTFLLQAKHRVVTSLETFCWRHFWVKTKRPGSDEEAVRWRPMEVTESDLEAQRSTKAREVGLQGRQLSAYVSPRRQVYALDALCNTLGRHGGRACCYWAALTLAMVGRGPGRVGKQRGRVL